MTTYLYFLPYHKILKAFPKKFPTEIKQRTQKPNTREKMGQEKRKKSRAFPNFRSSKKAAECSTYIKYAFWAVLADYIQNSQEQMSY